MSLSSSPRPRQNGVAIACILSGGLITAAIINSHRPVVVSPGSSAAMLARATPPIDQESAKQQFETQMAEQVPNLKLLHDGTMIKGVKSVDVSYSAKEDTFEFDFTPVFNVNAAEGTLTSMTATNDGYGHYKGSTNLGGTDEDARIVSVVIR